MPTSKSIGIAEVFKSSDAIFVILQSTKHFHQSAITAFTGAITSWVIGGRLTFRHSRKLTHLLDDF